MEKGSKDREGGDCPNEPSASCGQMPERAQSLTWTWGPSMCHHASPQHNWVASVNHLHHQKLARDFWPRWTCEHALHVSGDVASIIFELENCKKTPFSEARCEALSTPFFSTGCYGFSTGSLHFTTGFLRVPIKIVKAMILFNQKVQNGIEKVLPNEPYSHAACW